MFRAVSGCGVIAQWSERCEQNQRPWDQFPVVLPEIFRFSVPMSALSFDGCAGNGLIVEYSG